MENNEQQNLLNKRLVGLLPTIDIMGHTFYVDLRMGSLRPKDDFSTEGIKFKDIENYAQEERDTYHIPYNPKTHSFQEIDWLNLTAIPNDIVVIEVPFPEKLDPVSYARLHGYDINSFIKDYPIEENMKAGIIPWKDTQIEKFIAENKKKGLNIREHETSDKPKLRKRKGRSI